MIAKQQETNRPNATTAITSLAAGLLAAALAVYTQTDHRAFTSPSPAVTDGKASAVTTVQPDLTFLPRVRATAEADVAPVVAEQPRPVSPSTEKSVHEIKPRIEEPCVPYWHELEHGPVGRRVLVTCPGA